MAKATQAAESARTLLTSGDADGACNRAYYAMFDAARAALRVAGHDVGKTHRGVLNAFNEHLVRGGPMPKDAGRLLKLAEASRYVADHGDDAVGLADRSLHLGTACTGLRRHARHGAAMNTDPAREYRSLTSSPA